MSERHLVLVAYDIADPRRLQRVAHALEAVGDRVQKSVFECGLTPDGLIALRERLRTLIDPQEDHILLQPLCPRCRHTLVWQGKPPPAESEAFWVV